MFIYNNNIYLCMLYSYVNYSFQLISFSQFYTVFSALVVILNIFLIYIEFCDWKDNTIKCTEVQSTLNKWRFKAWYSERILPVPFEKNIRCLGKIFDVLNILDTSTNVFISKSFRNFSTKVKQRWKKNSEKIK